VSGGLHLLAFIASAALLIVWISRIVGNTRAEILFCLCLFLGSMALLFLASSLYHLVSANEKITRRLRQLDHAMIYIFIAGCITPFCLVFQSFEVRIFVWLGVWILALSGILSTSLLSRKSRWIRVLSYVLLGAVGVTTVLLTRGSFSPGVLLWLFIGCAAYVSGSVIYATKRPDPYPEYFGFHEIWHIFVILGSASHTIAILSLLSMLAKIGA
jgi:hemolysin III